MRVPPLSTCPGDCSAVFVDRFSYRRKQTRDGGLIPAASADLSIFSPLRGLVSLRSEQPPPRHPGFPRAMRCLRPRYVSRLAPFHDVDQTYLTRENLAEPQKSMLCRILHGDAGSSTRQGEVEQATSPERPPENLADGAFYASTRIRTQISRARAKGLAHVYRQTEHFGNVSPGHQFEVLRGLWIDIQVILYHQNTIRKGVT